MRDGEKGVLYMGPDTFGGCWGTSKAVFVKAVLMVKAVFGAVGNHCGQ